MERPLVFATVGTDHHRFDRLVEWVDRWLGDRQGEPVECLVQHGTSRAPARATRSSPYLDYQEMRRSFERAAVVICHGGPSTIMDAKAAGRMPIALPRRPELGEHVDGHQVRFVSRLVELGQVWTADDEQAFAERMEEALRAAPVRIGGEQDARVGLTIARFGTLVDGLLDTPVVHRRSGSGTR